MFSLANMPCGDGVRLACEFGHLEVAQKIFALRRAPQSEGSRGGRFAVPNETLFRTCFGGHAGVVRWLFSIQGWRANEVYRATKAAGEEGHVELALWLLGEVRFSEAERAKLVAAFRAEGRYDLAIRCERPRPDDVEPSDDN